MNRIIGLIRKKREGFALFLLSIPFLLYLFAFCYVPLFGWSISMFSFKPILGFNLRIQEYEGLSNFIEIWSHRREVWRALSNTLALNGLSLLLSPMPMLFAILCAEIKNKTFLRVAQTITTFPNFISWIMVYGIVYTIFSNNGVIASLKLMLGYPQQTESIINSADNAWIFHVLLGLWKGMGWSAIIYCAAIAGIDETLYEAARIDGANRLRCIWHITIPGIIETYFVVLLLNISSLLGTSFDHYYVFYNSVTASKLLTLDLYVYRQGINMGDYSYSTAAGIASSVVSLTILFSMNAVSKKVRGASIV